MGKRDEEWAREVERGGFREVDKEIGEEKKEAEVHVFCFLY